MNQTMYFKAGDLVRGFTSKKFYIVLENMHTLTENGEYVRLHNLFSLDEHKITTNSRDMESKIYND